MRPLHELFTEAASRPNVSLPSRRGLLALAGAAASAPAIVGLESAFAQSADRQGKRAKDDGKNKNKGKGDKDAKERARERREKMRARNKKRDIAILNYALTLEHLEYAFYRDGLQSENLDDNDDFPTGVRALLIEIRDHEDEHVEFLTETIESLGGTPVEEAPCYNFGDSFDSGDDFLATARLLENTGVMAYTGAIAGITSKTLQTGGATIATVEARHASYLNLVVANDPFPDAFDVPKSKAEILEAAAPFFNCP